MVTEMHRVVGCIGARREARVRIPVAWQHPHGQAGRVVDLRWFDGGRITFSPVETPP